MTIAPEAINLTASPALPRASLPARACSGLMTWARPGKMRPAILLWALGVPIPLIILFLLIRGCAA
jgi:hypothetical protein